MDQVVGQQFLEERGYDAVGKGGSRADGDESVHVRGAISKGGPARAMDGPADPEVYGCGDEEEEPELAHHARQEAEPLLEASQEDDD